MSRRERTFMRVATRPNGPRVSCSLYNIWHSMRLRCFTPGYRDYKYYGGRGITICDEWSNYETFRTWALANGFGKGMSIERNNVHRGYAPDNCSWIPKSHQQDNTRRVHRLTVSGVTKSLPEWARLRGIKATVINSRLQMGWNHEQAVTIPIGQGRPAEFHKKRGRKPLIRNVGR